MGAVFFVGFLLVLFFIGLFLLTGFLAFFLVGLLGGRKHKKMRFFYIPAGILFLLGGFCTASPFIFLGFVKKMNEETTPLIGHYIDQDTYQDQTFSVDGVTYDLMPYRPIFGNEKNNFEPFCTYRSWFFFMHMNTGYYYRLVNDKLDYVLVTSYHDTLFTKHEDRDRVYQYYKDGVAHWTSSRTGTALGAEADAVDFESFRKNDSLFLPYAEADNSIFFLQNISEDGYVEKDFAQVFPASDGFYYLKIAWDYTDGALTQVEALKLPDSFQVALKNEESSLTPTTSESVSSLSSSLA
jgi:hypothetical protein